MHRDPLLTRRSLSIQKSVSVLGTRLSPVPCVDRSVGLSLDPESVLWQTADWIRMQFGVVSAVGRGMGALAIRWGGDRRMGRSSFGVNLGHPIIPL